VHHGALVPDRDLQRVWSSDGGRVREESPARPGAAARRAASTLPVVPADGVVRVHRDRKGRGGKVVTIVTGLPGTPGELDALLTELKQRCGSGGTREGSALLVQGDHRERLVGVLEARGHRVKLAGG
jgi:translation initiation factor 1